MARKHKSRSGSLQFWPRKRAKRAIARVRSWLNINDFKPLMFAGYKVGMVQVLAQNNTPNSPTKGSQISIPATILECPPLNVFSIRYYKKTYYGLRLISEHVSDKVDKELKRKLKVPKKINHKEIKEYDDIRLLAHTNPKLTGIGKKKPEIVEIGLSGSKEEKEKFAKEMLGKQLKLTDVFNNICFVDVHGITKGKGFQGPVKRFGISLKSHKSEKKRRSTGNLGSFTPRKTDWRVPQHGQMGFHTRTEYNKLLLAVNPENIKNMKDIHKYGNVKNDYLLIKGSVIGPKKRLIKFSHSIRQPKVKENYEINSIRK